MKCLSYLYLMGRVSGLWPAENPDKYYMLKQFLRLIIVTYCGIGLVWHTVALINDSKSEFVELLEAIFISVCYLNLSYSYLVCFWMRKRWMNELERLTNFDYFGQPPNLAQLYKRLNMLSLGFFIYLLVAIITLQMNELIFYQSCQEKYHKLDREVICGSLFKIHYSYNVTTGIFWFLHFFIPFFTTYILIGGTVFPIAVIVGAELIIIRIDHLNMMILDVFIAPTYSEQKLKFRVCCMYHQYIIQLGDDLATLYLPVVCPVPINYSILIGIQLLSLNEEFSLKPFINLLGWIGGTFVVCSCSERLAEKSCSTAAAIYESRWYEADVKLRRDMLIMMMRAQRPRYLTIGVLGTLSNETFKVVMKGSYTYATLRSNT